MSGYALFGGAGGGSGGGGFVPYFIASDETFSVPESSQAPYTTLIDVEGVLSVDGILAEVN